MTCQCRMRMINESTSSPARYVGSSRSSAIIRILVPHSVLQPQSQRYHPYANDALAPTHPLQTLCLHLGLQTEKYSWHVCHEQENQNKKEQSFLILSSARWAIKSCSHLLPRAHMPTWSQCDPHRNRYSSKPDRPLHQVSYPSSHVGNVPKSGSVCVDGLLTHRWTKMDCLHVISTNHELTHESTSARQPFLWLRRTVHNAVTNPCAIVTVSRSPRDSAFWPWPFILWTKLVLCVCVCSDGKLLII